ncbi:hypothetical protein J5TS1_00640 [Bacillus licheniformis]|nr:hypothetical protein MUY_004449 [Bacillus licheniformis WX-02]GBC64564.1 hypothetical protein BLHB2_03850 [Bacillus licheniformis]GIN24401.1 hypothetical protein J31TS2_09810 [Bacillus licheniformis]GIN28940.1 hypothetical protein J2TS5_09790 [Bacillus licheniformis]GIN32561.1 hypothetical protein J5TS1_00640 [Bacillus licheniformis]
MSTQVRDFSKVVSKWIEWDTEYAYEYWTPIKQGISLSDTEKRATLNNQKNILVN